MYTFLNTKSIMGILEQVRTSLIFLKLAFVGKNLEKKESKSNPQSKGIKKPRVWTKRKVFPCTNSPPRVFHTKNWKIPLRPQESGSIRSRVTLPKVKTLSTVGFSWCRHLSHFSANNSHLQLPHPRLPQLGSPGRNSWPQTPGRDSWCPGASASAAS